MGQAWRQWDAWREATARRRLIAAAELFMSSPNSGWKGQGLDTVFISGHMI